MKTAGLLDLQVNGYAGVDFNDPAITADALDHAFGAMRESGVTACLPTLISAEADVLKARFAALDAAVSASRLGPVMVPGYHLEGPFLNAGEGYSGCHPASAMGDPDSALIFELEKALDRPILIVTLAPERNGALETIRALKAAGKTVSVGHSAAGFSEIRAAADAGLSLSTHLGNGLPQTLPKLENTLLAQLAEPRLSAGLIADGHHMSPEALDALVRIKGVDRCILVTDAISGAAAAPGRYEFAGMQVELSETGRIANPGGVGLAGSGLRLDEGVRNVIAWGIADFATAIRMASDNPRQAIAESLTHHGITLRPGEVFWDENLGVTVTDPGGVT